MKHKVENNPICPNCMMPMNGAINADENSRPPRSGDITVCAYCQAVLRFDRSMQLEQLTDYQVDSMSVENKQGIRYLQHAGAMMMVERFGRNN